MDEIVVSQATPLTIPQTIASEAEGSGTQQITLARMEIGGMRFVLPLGDVAAVIEPTSMEAHSDDPYGIWIGHVRSQQGAIAIANGSALIRTANKAIPPGRIAILRGEFPIGLAVDRMLSAQTVNRDALHALPDIVPALQPCPVTAVLWGADDELELMLDRQMLIDELDAGFLGSRQSKTSSRYNQQRMLDRYGDVDYTRGLEVAFAGSQERWVLPMTTVRLVTDSRRPHPLPRTPDKVLGLVAWQRDPIPVVDPSAAIGLEGRVSLPAKFVVIGEPVTSGQTSTHADTVVVVDRIVGIHNNLRTEHGYTWDSSGDALNIIKIPSLLT